MVHDNHVTKVSQWKWILKQSSDIPTSIIFYSNWWNTFNDWYRHTIHVQYIGSSSCTYVKMVIDPKNHPCLLFHILEMVEILSRKARQVPSSPTPHLYLEIGLWSHPHKWQCALCYCHWDFIFWDLITAYQNMLDLNVSIEDCPFWKTISTQFELSVLVLTLFHH